MICFGKDGDYNCDIPSQRSSKLNKPIYSNGPKSFNGSVCGNSSIHSLTTAPTNGLCLPCNRNQELKMQQLASFEPTNEAYFDEEVEDFRRKLEQAYRLCPRCERHLKRTLNNVKKNILGSKLAQLGTKGFQMFDLDLNNSKTENSRKRQLLFAKICVGALILISILNALEMSTSINLNRTKLEMLFNPTVTSAILMVISYLSAMKILAGRAIGYIGNTPYISFAASLWRLFIQTLYTSISPTGWSIQSIFKEQIAPLMEELQENSSNVDSTDLTKLIAGAAGCLLSACVIFLGGASAPTVFSLILWTAYVGITSVIAEISSQPIIVLLEFVVVCAI